MEKKTACMVCGGEFGRDKMRHNVAVPMWFDRNMSGQEVEPFAHGVSLTICEGCYRKATVLYSQLGRDEKIEFRPFPNVMGATGRAVDAISRSIEDDGKGFDEEWWRQLVCDDDGVPDMEKVMAEFHDFDMLIRNMPRVYDAVTNGRISKPHTEAWVVIAEVEDITRGLIDEAVEETREEMREEGR